MKKKFEITATYRQLVTMTIKAESKEQAEAAAAYAIEMGEGALIDATEGYSGEEENEKFRNVEVAFYELDQQPDQIVITQCDER